MPNSKTLMADRENSLVKTKHIESFFFRSRILEFVRIWLLRLQLSFIIFYGIGDGCLRLDEKLPVTPSNRRIGIDTATSN